MIGKPGFTLLEMLVSVAIFSGLVILILAVFVRTASSQARVNVLREKSEAARSMMSRITADLQYTYKDHQVRILNRTDNILMTGFQVEENYLALLLRYPNKSDSDLVFKKYRVEPGRGASRSAILEVEEFRGCEPELQGSGEYRIQTEVDCRDAHNSNGFRSVMPEGFLLDNHPSRPVFAGYSPDSGNITGYVKIALNIKPSEYDESYCSQGSVPKGTCYKVETALSAGGIN